MTTIPISLYIHIPWCIKKCPYCDFNSHVSQQQIPEKKYLSALCQDFDQQLCYLQSRKIETIFIGGGTPSLMSPDFYNQLINHIKPYCITNPEITLEANPGTIDFSSSSTTNSKFHAYRQLGINRLSLGIQSFSPEKLKYIGRMHSEKEAVKAIELAKTAGFDNWNGDLMFGLPSQTINEAMYDLTTLTSFNPPHISWYQLTIEPNTQFYKRRPQHIPNDDALFEFFDRGRSYLNSKGYDQYEISAYAKNKKYCKHNLNYWKFGDYIGIGAGAHGKITQENPFIIRRTQTPKHPRLYLETAQKHQAQEIKQSEYMFEAMLNMLRLNQNIPFALIENRTQIPTAQIQQKLAQLQADNLLYINKQNFQLTPKGRLFINEILEQLI